MSDNAQKNGPFMTTHTGNPPALRALVREGVALFNGGQFFECHEVLEQAWLSAQGAEKLFLQGLIQVAVAFYHLRRGNFPGAERLLGAGIEKLSGNATDNSPVDSAELTGALKPLLEQLRAGAAAADWPCPAMRLRSAN